MITLTGCFYLKLALVNGTMKSDHIKWLITLTGDYIKRLSLYHFFKFQFASHFSKSCCLPCQSYSLIPFFLRWPIKRQSFIFLNFSLPPILVSHVVSPAKAIHSSHFFYDDQLRDNPLKENYVWRKTKLDFDSFAS